MTSTPDAELPEDERAAPYPLGAMPHGQLVRVVDELVIKSRLATIFRLAVDVERWPQHLRHYRYVRFRERTVDDGGLVEMSANRPFGPLDWPTRWVSQMAVQRQTKKHVEEPRIRYRHVEGVTRGMEVEWSFHPASGGTRVRIVHVWNGPGWPLIGGVAARAIIAPLFVHGIASRTLAGLASVAEREPL